MGRKTYEAEGADRLNRATGDAARILSGDLAACSKMLRAMLEIAAAEEGWDEKLAVIQGAVELAGAAVKMGDTIGRLKRRNPPAHQCPAQCRIPRKCTAIRTQNARISHPHTQQIRRNFGFRRPK
jgi:hypothetical protein